MKSSLRDNFCSSPWFHIRIDPQGNYLPCRWGNFSFVAKHHVSDTTLTGYLNSDEMSNLRSTLLEGSRPSLCVDCHYESSHGKVSGRQRQLLKSAIHESNFNKTFCSSPHWDHFSYSYANQGQTQTQPVDLQIDLGNTCNSSCIMCPPKYSSRAIEEHKKLHKINPILFKDPVKLSNWSDDLNLVDKFVSELSQLDNIRYIHMLGGETLFIKSFYDICNKLIESGLSKNIILGLTTNCTLYDDRIENIIKNFKQVQLGMSIEAVTDLNDYIRWPSQISTVLGNIDKFLNLRSSTDLQTSLRITPNIFSIWHLDSIFEFMINNHVIAESCNILYEPRCLRIELLPNDLRNNIINKLNKIIDKFNLVKPQELIINRRREDLIDPVISSVIFEYRDFLVGYTPPDDVEQQRLDLVQFLKSYETIHNNSILGYLPEYEKFLRSYNY